ncbi:MAG: ABC transporter permease subunit [Bacilli bacterium]|nr:ABC transporter permease subunit [Bacilli bacterium]
MRNEKRTRNIHVLMALLGFVFLIGLWYIISAILISKENYGLPYPHDTGATLWDLLVGKNARGTWRAIGWTLFRAFIGWVVSFVLAGIFGILAGIFENVKAFMKPIVAFQRTIPTVAVVLLLLSIILGSGRHGFLNWAPIVLIIFVIFPLLYESFRAGVENIDQGIINALRVEGGERKPNAIAKVLVPEAWPYVKAGIAQTLGLALKTCIMSEVLTASSATKSGIGTLIATARVVDVDGGITKIPAYAILALLLMVIIDMPAVIAKRKEKGKQ